MKRLSSLPTQPGHESAISVSSLAVAASVTAVAIGRRLGLPKRVMTILTGESLVNDAAALTVFTITLTTVTGGHAFIANPFLFFGWSVIVVGVAHRARFIQRRIMEQTGAQVAAFQQVGAQ